MKTLLFLCVPGYYCDVAGLSAVAGECQEGYYCTLGAEVPAPTDGVTGDICPVGRYCPTGTGVPELCPSGTFSNAQGNIQLSDCQDCTSGKYLL